MATELVTPDENTSQSEVADPKIAHTAQEVDSMPDQLWQRLQLDLLTNFPEKYSANIQLIKNILTYKDSVHPAAVVTSYFTIISALTAEYFYTDLGSSTTLYTVAIAKSGYGKDIAIRVTADVLNALNDKYKMPTINNILTSKLTSVSALDRIFKDNRLIVQIYDEFGDALGEMQGGGHARALTVKFKELYSLTDKKYESGNYARSNRANDQKVVREYPCFILTGVTTKTQLLTRLKKEMIHDGFLNRFIFLEGSDLKGYSTESVEYGMRKVGNAGNDILKDIFDFYSKTYKYENTTINMSEEAWEYYTGTIGKVNQEGTDIDNFCKTPNEDYETNEAISSRWRENALRLATAITAYEYGVKASKDDLKKFQEASAIINKVKPIISDNFAITAEDEKDNKNVIKLEERINQLMQNKCPDKEGCQYELRINKHFFPGIYKKTSGHEQYKSFLHNFRERQIRRLIGTEDQQLYNSARHKVENSIQYKTFLGLKKTMIEHFEEEQEPRERDKKFIAVKLPLINSETYGLGEKTTLYVADLTSEELLELQALAANAQKTNNGEDGKSEGNSHLVGMVFVEKDILEWSYNFIKTESIKFFNVFHEEVEQSKYDRQRTKAIQWLRDNDGWHTLTHLGENVRAFKDPGATVRRRLLKELVSDSIVTQLKRNGALYYRYRRQLGS